MHGRAMIGLMLTISLLTGTPTLAQKPQPPDQQEDTIGPTPPRLSFVDGQVSFWRPGAQEWVQGQINTPLAPGDQLYTGSPGNLELQIGARAFVRGWANTQVGLENQEPDFLQFKVTTGYASFDLRTLEPGYTVEVDTPNAAFTIEHPGYYRVHVAGDRTSFITRRAGRATVTPASGEAVAIAASEEVVIEGTDNPQVSSFVAPKLDDWDKWNYARTDALLEAVSARYVPSGTYGVDDLDHFGNWRVVDEYGPVWVPTGVAAGWAPYTTGAWTLDPFYGWTWVDTAPWGWAPYHYGRWVFVNNFWAWAPGPLVARPVYAPALVAFLGGPGVGVSVSVGGPLVGWVALGWGEPCVPWWGRSGFIHRPWWGGWGGPRVVNNVVIHRTTVVHVEQINVYRNTHVRNGVVVVDERRFGHGRIGPARVTHVDVREFHPIHTAPRVAPTPASYVPTATRGIPPPERHLERRVVATRPPHRREVPTAGGERRAGPTGAPEPEPRLVTAPPRREPAAVLARPPFGQSTIERPAPDRPRPPVRQRPEGARATERGPEAGPPGQLPTPSQPRPEAKVNAPSPATPQPPAARPEAAPRPADRGQTPPTSPTAPQSRPEPKAVTPSPGAPASPATPPTVSRPSAGRGQTPAPARPEGQGHSKQGLEAPSAATRPAVPQSRPEPKVAAPSPGAPAAPAAPREMSRPSPDPGQTSAPARQEGQGRSVKGPQAPAPGQRQAVPQARPEPRVAAPPPAASQPAGQPEVSSPRGRQLPGEPANRLSPSRAEPKPQGRVERQASSPRPQGEREPVSRERQGVKP